MKINRLFPLFAVLVTMLFLITCGKDDENPAAPDPVEENYIPYKVGNTWTYQVTPTSGDPTYTATLEVVDKITENNNEMAIVKEQSSKNPSDFSLLCYQNTENSLLMHKIADYNPTTADTSVFEFSTPATWLKVPFVKNDTWQVFTYQGDPAGIPLIGAGLGLDSAYVGLTVNLTLSGKTIAEEKVTTAGEDFQAFKVDFDYNAVISGIISLPGKLGSFWVVPEVGIVRIAFYDLQGTITELRVMTSYTLN
jgi:hypothetical protein